jgi:small-conductance mechanosensitive channel
VSTGNGDEASAPSPLSVEAALWRYCSRPVMWGLPLLVLYLALPLVFPQLVPGGAVGRLFAVALILVLAWLAAGAVRAGEAVMRDRFRVDVRDNLRARKVHTQLEIVRKILVVVIGLIALAGVLMTFEPLRRFGTGLLASAGLAGLILGLAAQKTLGNLLAGIQIALTQPIRLDDVVIVEGEWGWVEELTLTYVVVRIWDLRRMVLPIGWFIENPFQNWTRTSANILGTVFLHTDYSVPVGEVRGALERFVKESPHWDGVVWRLHVTEAGPRSVELRCLMSAADSPSAWELRCEVREKLLDWLQREHPEALPRVRAEVEPLPRDPGAADPREAERFGS